MSTLLLGLLSAALATNQPAVVSNLVEKATIAASKSPDPNDPVEQELKKLEEDDDKALEEIDQWIRENQEFAEKDAAIPNAELNQRIRTRLEMVRKAYEDFIERNPRHSGVRLAYASFLHDTGNEQASLVHLETARDLDPNNPAIWNNLANYHGHVGEVTNAFAYYAKAISLNPTEPVYYHNFGTTVYLFRKDAREFYQINEQQVFDKAMSLYSNSMRLDPTNFWLASDVAQSYYGIRPLRTNDALQAWTNAMKIAPDDSDRQGVHLHLARVKTSAAQYDEAKAHLNAVTRPEHQEVKERLSRNLLQRQSGTNWVEDTGSSNQESARLSSVMTSTNSPASNSVADPHVDSE